MNAFTLYIDIEGFYRRRLDVLAKSNMAARMVHRATVWSHVKETNKATGLAYHNFYHTAWMVQKVYELGGHYAIDKQMLRGDLVPLVVAAMYHDIDHSGGLNVEDRSNVHAAALRLEQDAMQFPELVRDYQPIKDMIECTQYPFVVPPKTLSEKILRDADILFGMTVDFEKIIYCDLYSELLASKPSLSFDQFVEGQKNFVKNAEMFTEAGKERKELFIKKHAQPFWDRYDAWKRSTQPQYQNDWTGDGQ